MKDTDTDSSDIPELGDEFFTKAAEPWPPAKQQLTIRLDVDVLNWLRASKGYHSRINYILRAAMESQPTRRRPAPMQRPPRPGLEKLVATKAAKRGSR